MHLAKVPEQAGTLVVSFASAVVKRSRSAGPSWFAFLRMRTITALDVSVSAAPVLATRMTASPSALLGFPTTPATQNSTGVPSDGSTKSSDGART
jgi:hypothetical protein